MFRASSAHLQDNTVVYMQHMVLSQFVVACRCTAHAVYREATRNSRREWQYHMLRTTVSSWRCALEARNM